MFEKLIKDSNIFYSASLNAIAIYDHKIYDRSDLDILNGAQRSFIINKLKSFGFMLVSGNRLESVEAKMLFPKNAHIASSPLDLIKYTKRKDECLILTPMQLFLYLLDEGYKYTDENYIKESMELVQKMPVNLKKIKDICQNEPFYVNFLEKYKIYDQLQVKAIETNLKNKLHIGKML